MFSNTYTEIYLNRNAIRLKRILEMKNRFSYDPIIGSVTSTFFPINIVMLLFMYPVVVVKNKKFNEMINKLQYGLLILFYSVAIFFLQVFLAPFIYAKLILNAINIMLISKQSKGIERYFEPFFILLVGPFIIGLSILADLVSLFTVLLQSEEHFEQKYQSNSDELNDDQLEKVNRVFKKILYD
mmetsp:Transcript_624/g.717  ORF Transcript_624/g.717 Transcript_624/m.717 type:complete len:184 (-) Transcript_624:66-617(-)